MKKLMFSLAALLAAASACTEKALPQSEETPLQEPLVFYATYEDNDSSTRTFRDDDGTVYWSPNERLIIYLSGYSGNARFLSTNTEPATSTYFREDGWHLSSYEFADWVATTQSYGGTTLQDTYLASDGYYLAWGYLPSWQKAVPHTWEVQEGGWNYFVSIARSKTKNLVFRHFTGGIKFTLNTPGVKRVLLRTEDKVDLVGDYYARVYEDRLERENRSFAQHNEVVLMAPEGETLTPGVPYYLVTLPATMPSGFSLTFVTDDKMARRTYSKSVTIQSGHFATLLEADKGLTWGGIGATLSDVTETPIEE